MSGRRGKNNRWSHERQVKRAKAERREEKARLHLARNAEQFSESEIVRPPGYVSPYASERRKQERTQGKKNKKHKGVSSTAFAMDIDTIATEILGGTYYCVGRDRTSNPQLRAQPPRPPVRGGDPVPPVRRVAHPGYL